MTDDHADDPATDAEDRADAGDADEDRPSSDTMSTPGGGPRRVVSSKGVDDILESLNSGPAASATEPNGAETKTGAEDGDATANDPTDTDASETTAERNSESESERTSTSASSAGSTSSASETLSAIRGGHESDGHDRPLEDEREDSGTADAKSDSSTELSFQESDVDELEAPSADTTEGDDGKPDPDDLAARIDSNTVTGADVRAAEAGEGREKTPEVDEIDLSMGDLEQTRSSVGGSRSTGGSGDGPLAGTIGPDEASSQTGSPDGARNGEAADESDADDPAPDPDLDSDADSTGSGLLGRVRSLFSR